MNVLTTVLMLGAVIAFPIVGYGQRAAPDPPGVGRFVYDRHVAVIHTRDYMQQNHLYGQFPEQGSAWQTRTSLFGINGTDRVADVGVYVFGNGQLYLSLFRRIEPGRESYLLPGEQYFGPTPDKPNVDGVPPEYRGETIVIVSSEPLIVTGQVTRGRNTYFSLIELDLDLGHLLLEASTSRTLDVRQFDCSVPAEFLKVAYFCRNLPAVQPQR